VILSSGGQVTAQTAKAATATIPIVFTTNVDPVATGLVASINRPGGNMTGVTFFAAELSAKRLEILRELAPSTTIAILVNSNEPTAELQIRDTVAAANAIGQRIQVMKASTDRDFEGVSAALARERPGALMVTSDAFFLAQRNQVTALAARYSIPAIYASRDYVIAGGLISYAASITDTYRQAGVYVGKILKGAKPIDLPVVRPTKSELVINLKAAKVIGLTLPATLLARADEVIE
jgi:ABC-type uncharacterized transport system substrate-binding protein